MKKIALYGGTFNPPHEGHRQIVRKLSAKFDDVVVFPCGPRPEKVTADILSPIYRATMCDLAFRDIPGVRVDLGDLEKETYTRTYELVNRFLKDGEVWIVVGSDLIKPGPENKADVRTWEDGEELWRHGRFIILDRPGYELLASELPPHSSIFSMGYQFSSSEIRQKLFNREDISDLVSPEVGRYISRYKLYSGKSPLVCTELKIEEPRILFVADEANSRAVDFRDKLSHLEDKRNPNLIVTLGGDGTMLHAIRNHWSKRLPFCGFNLGHKGFLLNDEAVLLKILEGSYRFENLQVYREPLLRVEVEDMRGNSENLFAFNDSWVERQTFQTAGVKILINNQVFEESLKCDLALVATPAGSTSYAVKFGATPLYIDAQNLILVVSAAQDAPYQRSHALELTSQIEFIALDPAKRPIRAAVDNVGFNDVARMKVQVSNIACVELAYHPDHDITRKVRNIHKA